MDLTPPEVFDTGAGTLLLESGLEPGLVAEVAGTDCLVPFTTDRGADIDRLGPTPRARRGLSNALGGRGGLEEGRSRMRPTDVTARPVAPSINCPTVGGCGDSWRLRIEPRDTGLNKHTRNKT